MKHSTIIRIRNEPESSSSLKIIKLKKHTLNGSTNNKKSDEIQANMLTRATGGIQNFLD
jgi:hypothetical protein